MKSLLSLSFFYIIICSVFVSTACKREGDPAVRKIDENTTITAAPEPDNLDVSKVQYLEADEFNRLSKKGSAVLLDVRLPGEFDKGHIDGAVNINFFDPEFKQNLLKLDRDKKYYVYCKNESRSRMTAAYMNFNEFEHVYVLKGGYEDWKETENK